MSSVEKPRNEGTGPMTSHDWQRPPAKTSRSGDKPPSTPYHYQDHPGYRRASRVIATIIFWLFWVALGIAIAALDASLILRWPHNNPDSPLGFCQLAAGSLTFVLGVFIFARVFTWTNRNRYK